MYDCFHARVYVHSAIALTATLALMLCYLDVIDSTSLSFNPTYRIERCLLFWASVASSRKCRDRLGTRKKFRVNRPEFQHTPPWTLTRDILLYNPGPQVKKTQISLFLGFPEPGIQQNRYFDENDVKSRVGNVLRSSLGWGGCKLLCKRQYSRITWRTRYR